MDMKSKFFRTFMIFFFMIGNVLFFFFVSAFVVGVFATYPPFMSIFNSIDKYMVLLVLFPIFVVWVLLIHFIFDDSKTDPALWVATFFFICWA